MTSHIENSEIILSAIEGGNMDFDTAANAIRHLTECASCREALSFVAAAKAFFKSRQEKAAADEAAWGRTVNWLNARIFAKDEEADALAAAIDRNDIVFIPSREDGDAPAFMIKLTFPDSPAKDIDVNLEDAPAEMLNGVFSLCGVKAEVKDGKGSLSLREFKENLTKGGSTYQADGSPVELKCTPVLFPNLM